MTSVGILHLLEKCTIHLHKAKHIRTAEGKALFKSLKFELAPRGKRKRSPEPIALEIRPDVMSNFDEAITAYDSSIPKQQFLDFVAKNHPGADVSNILAKIG